MVEFDLKSLLDSLTIYPVLLYHNSSTTPEGVAK